MLLIAFTRPGFYAGEAEELTGILGQVDALHLRKEPEGDATDWSRLIAALPEAHRHKIWLHGHHPLAESFGLGGVHLGRKHLEGCSDRAKLAAEWRRRGLRVSTTCHDPAEIAPCAAWADRLFIAPVFDSISKPGHRSAWDLNRWSVPTDERTEFIALGGVGVGQIPVLQRAGFDGAAVLGALWGASDPVARIVELKEACRHLAFTY